MIDPSPWVNGAGRAALEAAGIRTFVGAYAAEARRLNEGYLQWVASGRPLVIAVYAMSLDGTIFDDGVDSHVGEAARREIDRLRARADRRLVGVRRLLRDDPDLKGLGSQGVTSLVVECRAADLAALTSAGLADKVVALITPVLVGRASGSTGAARPISLHGVTFQRLGNDLMVVGYTSSCSAES